MQGTCGQEKEGNTDAVSCLQKLMNLSQYLETTQMSINRIMTKPMEVCLPSGILFSDTKEYLLAYVTALVNF